MTIIENRSRTRLIVSFGETQVILLRARVAFSRFKSLSPRALLIRASIDDSRDTRIMRVREPPATKGKVKSDRFNYSTPFRRQHKATKAPR